MEKTLEKKLLPQDTFLSIFFINFVYSYVANIFQIQSKNPWKNLSFKLDIIG